MFVLEKLKGLVLDLKWCLWLEDFNFLWRLVYFKFLVVFFEVWLRELKFFRLFLYFDLNKNVLFVWELEDFVIGSLDFFICNGILLFCFFCLINFNWVVFIICFLFFFEWWIFSRVFFMYFRVIDNLFIVKGIICFNYCMIYILYIIFILWYCCWYLYVYFLWLCIYLFILICVF